MRIARLSDISRMAVRSLYIPLRMAGLRSARTLNSDGEEPIEGYCSSDWIVYAGPYEETGPDQPERKSLMLLKKRNLKILKL